MKHAAPTLSILSPCYNEAGNVAPLLALLSDALVRMAVSYEIILVDDGSSDDTLATIKSLQSTYPTLRYLSFTRNFGHQKALLAGLRAARGEAVITMDADLQHPVSMLPLLMEQWYQGYEVVNTLRSDAAQTSFFKRTTSALFYKLLNQLTGLGLEAGSADFRLLDRKVVSLIAQSREDDLFLRGLLCQYGFRQTSLPYVADARHAGTTKFTLSKMMALAANGVTSFSIKPLRMGMVLSGLFALFSVCEILYVLYTTLFTNRTVSGWASLAILIALLGACTLLMLGIVGEYVGRAFMQSKGRPPYVVREDSEGDYAYKKSFSDSL